jgi:hypothetical protein
VSPKRSKLKLVPEAEAAGRIADIYGEIKQAFGVPLVSRLFQAYAVHPQFLDLLWIQLHPSLSADKFFSCAARLRAQAYTEAHNRFTVPNLREDMARAHLSPAACDEVAQIVTFFHYADAVQLLVSTAVMQAFEAPVGQGEQPDAPPASPSVIAERPVIIDEDAAKPEICKIYDDIKQTLGFPFVNIDYLAFARFPAFLTAYWNTLKSIVASPLYTRAQYEMSDTAFSMVRELPGKLDLNFAAMEEHGMDGDAISDVVHLTEMFVRNQSGLVLNVAVAKIGIEGGNVSRTEPAAPEPVKVTDESRVA